MAERASLFDEAAIRKVEEDLSRRMITRANSTKNVAKYCLLIPQGGAHAKIPTKNTPSKNIVGEIEKKQTTIHFSFYLEQFPSPSVV